MLLIKCKCGCLFTIKDDTSPSPSPYLKCQNCNTRVQYSPDSYELSLIKNDFAEAGMTVQKIPDNADFTITFKA
jgi:hypothetical protein